MSRYIALIDGERGAYGVAFPDCPGCTAMGATLDEAIRNAVAALAEWIDDEMDGGRAVPEARSVEDLRNDPEVAAALAEGAALGVVPVIRATGRPAKANLSLDSGLLQAIDDAAAAAGTTRSAFLAAAALQKILAS